MFRGWWGTACLLQLGCYCTVAKTGALFQSPSTPGVPSEKAWQVGLAWPSCRWKPFFLLRCAWMVLSSGCSSHTAPSMAVLCDCLLCLQIRRIRCPGHRLWFLWPPAQRLHLWPSLGGWIQSQCFLPSFPRILLWEKGCWYYQHKISISLSWKGNLISKRRRID